MEQIEPVEDLVTWVFENGSFIPCAKIAAEEKYSIVSDYLGSIAQDPKKPARSGGNGRAYEEGRPNHSNTFAEEVYNQSRDPLTGKVLDPVPNGKEIVWNPGEPRKGNWSLGHEPHYEYRHLHKAYMEGRITQEQFLEYYNNPRYYRPETPETSSSHAHESDVFWYPFDL